MKFRHDQLLGFHFFCRNLVVKQVALMVMLTRAPRFLGTMWYYYSLLLIFTFVTFFHYFRYVCILQWLLTIFSPVLSLAPPPLPPSTVPGGLSRVQAAGHRGVPAGALQGACEAGAGGLLDSSPETLSLWPGCAGSSSGGSAVWSRSSTYSFSLRLITMLVFW